MSTENARDSSIQSSEEFFASHLNPLVAITAMSLLNPLNASRSVGFLIEDLGFGLWLMATCKHPFQIKGRDRFIFAMKNPKPTMLRKVGLVLNDPEAESDVSFVVLEDKTCTKKRPFILTPDDLHVQESGQTLYNAKNQGNHISGVYDMPVGRQRGIVEGTQFFFCKVSEGTPHLVRRDDLVEQERLLSLGYFRYRGLWMVSRPGNSGSPIWDDNLRLFGMDIRGSTPETHPGQGDYLVCIPTSEIYKARQRIDPELNKILTALI